MRLLVKCTVELLAATALVCEQAAILLEDTAALLEKRSWS